MPITGTKFMAGLFLFATLGVAGSTTASAADANGEQLFRMRCQGCHSNVPGRNSPIAPNLAGIVGRGAGKTGYAYSPALKKADLVWTSDNLDKFLENPAKMLPGTRMPISVPDQAQRAALIAYLATVK